LAGDRGRTRRHRPELPESPTPPPARRPDQIRRAALELFAARGYPSTTIDDIGERAGIRGPSVYRHVRSKQALLAEIMMDTMGALLTAQREAMDSSDEVTTQFRRVVAAHVRYHARHQYEAFVGNREITSLEEPFHTEVLSRRRSYEANLRFLIEQGVRAGVFTIASPRLGSYSILDMGMGVSVWFHPGGELGERELVEHYVGIALRVVGALSDDPADPEPA
jgi:AcrR family transcriptional regulator